MAANINSNKMRKSSKKNSSSPRITNSSNDVSPPGNISWQLGDLLLSDNSSNISSNSRRNSSENLHRKILEQNHQLQNEPSSLAQTWHSGLFPSSSQSSISSRDLNSSKNSSGSRGNSNENLHRQLLKRNHHFQNEPRSFGTNLGKTWHSIQIVSSSDSDISPNSSNSSRDLNIEQAFNPIMAANNINSNKMRKSSRITNSSNEQAFQPIILHSSPSNSMAVIPPVYFSSSSSNESLDRAPSLNYYYNGSF